MKHKIIYLVLLTVTIQLPASSNECGKISQAAIIENAADSVLKSPDATAAQSSVLPASPFSRLLFNL
jgi:hypothetical protein